MKTKKLELKKEIIASLTNDGMANVRGGALDIKTKLDCPEPFSLNQRCYTLEAANCPVTQWNTCEDCKINNTLTCQESVDECILKSELCLAKTITCL